VVVVTVVVVTGVYVELATTVEEDVVVEVTVAVVDGVVYPR